MRWKHNLGPPCAASDRLEDQQNQPFFPSAENRRKSAPKKLISQVACLVSAARGGESFLLSCCSRRFSWSFGRALQSPSALVRPYPRPASFHSLRRHAWPS